MHRLGLIEDIARQRLPSGPGEGPEGGRKADLAELFLGFLPQLRGLVGHMQSNLRRVGHGAEPGLGENEGDGIGDHEASMERYSSLTLFITSRSVKPSRTRARAASPMRATRSGSRARAIRDSDKAAVSPGGTSSPSTSCRTRVWQPG